MNIILDTHAFLWWLDDNPSLSAAAFSAIKQGRNIVFVSAASVWEISIKKALGKLNAPDDLEDALAANRFRPLAITIPHAVMAGSLPRHHDDPFDRMLIAQAQIERLTLITHDARFHAYNVPLLWT
jgi:PIN domain nuclease of toxin-antitoxin system